MKAHPLLWLASFAIAAHAEDAKDAMIRCSRQSNEQSLKGDARKTYMLDCMHKAIPTEAPAGHAPDKPKGNPILGLAYYGSMAALDIMLGADSGELGHTDDFRQKSSDIREISKALDDLVPNAVKAAKGKPDLVKAIKDYYAAASAYMGNGIPVGRLEKIQSDRLKAEMDAKEKALDLEIKLAGIK